MKKSGRHLLGPKSRGRFARICLPAVLGALAVGSWGATAQQPPPPAGTPDSGWRTTPPQASPPSLKGTEGPVVPPIVRVKPKTVTPKTVPGAAAKAGKAPVPPTGKAAAPAKSPPVPAAKADKAPVVPTSKAAGPAKSPPVPSAKTGQAPAAPTGRVAAPAKSLPAPVKGKTTTAAKGGSPPAGLTCASGFTYDERSLKCVKSGGQPSAKAGTTKTPPKR
jgi:hypothetical protein